MMRGELKENISLGLLGISFKTAPVKVRDEVTLNEDEQRILLEEFKRDPSIEGSFIISTCNRTELYFSCENFSEIISNIRQRLNDFKKCDYFTNDQITYNCHGSDAVSHFFNVISSLDSQIVGEPQITGQVKDGYEIAHQFEATDSVINKLFNYGMQTKKKVHNDTYLSDGTVSVSFAGVELARKIFNDLDGKEILLIGAGKTAELAAYHFLENGIKSINVANRTFENAQKLADKFKGNAYRLDQLGSALQNADIVISATSSEEYVVTHELLTPIGKDRYYQPIFLIDLAIPRDIDPKIEEIDNVFLYNLDDLKEIVNLNIDQRMKEIPKAVRIVDEFVKEFHEWMSSYSMNAIVGKLKSHLNTIRLNEIQRFKKQLPENGCSKEIDHLTESIINKVVRQHVKSLKKNASDPELYQQQVDIIMNLFEADKE